LDACNVCGEKLEPLFPSVHDPLTNEVFSIVKCGRCGLGHTVPQPRDLGPYYREPYYGDRHAYTLRHCNKRRMGFVSAVASRRKAGRLLDIGCGDGSFLLAARGAGWVVTGTELNPRYARDAGFDVKESIDQIRGVDLFDCITMWHTLEHMRDVRALLARVNTLLAPKGRLIIAVPDAGGLQARSFGPKWFHLDVPRHLFHFNDAALSSILNKSGFTIERRWHQEFEYDLIGWSQSALNCVMPNSNAFYNFLTGKHGAEGPAARLSGIILGSFLSALSVPFLVAGTILRRGGTLIVSATRQETTASDV
jgi:SAM-dependent methyltransferase